MWSKGYHVTDAELRELYSAMGRHDGLFYLAAAAGFVADHKAQGDRLDFGQARGPGAFQDDRIRRTAPVSRWRRSAKIV
jgi:hypothetical protein